LNLSLAQCVVRIQANYIDVPLMKVGCVSQIAVHLNKLVCCHAISLTLCWCTRSVCVCVDVCVSVDVCAWVFSWCLYVCVCVHACSVGVYECVCVCMHIQCVCFCMCAIFQLPQVICNTSSRQSQTKLKRGKQTFETIEMERFQKDKERKRASQIHSKPFFLIFQFYFISHDH
jgi:hypothetical protein